MENSEKTSVLEPVADHRTRQQHFRFVLHEAAGGRLGSLPQDEQEEVLLTALPPARQGAVSLTADRYKLPDLLEAANTS